MQQQQQQQQLGLNSPPLNGSSSWGRTGFMQPPLMNGLSSNGAANLGLTSPPSRTLSPPPLGLHSGTHSPMMPIGPPSSSNSSSGVGAGSSGHLSQYNNFGGSGTNGLGLTVGSGRKSVSHLPPLRSDGVESSPNGGLMGTGFPPGYGSHSLQHQQHQHQQQQQQQQQHHAHRLGAIGEVGGPREGNFSL